MTNADVKRLLRKKKLSGKEAALLIIRNEWEEQTTGKGFLSDTEIEAIRSNVPPAQHAIFNEYINFNRAAYYALLDAGRLGLNIAATCGRLYPPLIAYSAEGRMRDARGKLPHVVTAKEYEERRLAQREDKLLEPVSLGYVLNWYAIEKDFSSETLLKLWDAYREGYPETLHEGPFSYAIHEIDDIELARPWLERLLEMLRDGRLEPVRYTEEAAFLATGYLETSADYASIYQEQSQRPGARDTAALIETIESYLAGSLAPAELDEMLWDWHVSGPELYEAGWTNFREYIDNYNPMLPEWPILAILQDEESLEAKFLINKETGHYRREHEDRLLQLVTMFDIYQKSFADGEGGLEGYLVDVREALIKRLRELTAFRLGLQAASKVLGIKLIQKPWDDLERGYEGIEQFNKFITINRVYEYPQLGEGIKPFPRIEPIMPIEPIDISSLEPDERVVELIQERMGKLLPDDWAKQELEPGPEEDAHEPA